MSAFDEPEGGHPPGSAAADAAAAARAKEHLEVFDRLLGTPDELRARIKEMDDEELKMLLRVANEHLAMEAERRETPEAILRETLRREAERAGE